MLDLELEIYIFIIALYFTAPPPHDGLLSTRPLNR